MRNQPHPNYLIKKTALEKTRPGKLHAKLITFSNPPFAEKKAKPEKAVRKLQMLLLNNFTKYFN